MTSEQAREKLVEFLDRRVFDPILRKSEDEFGSDAQKRKFADVKRSTESEKKRFHDEYRTADDVRSNYLSDLSSDVGKRKTRELEDLGLPSLPAVKEDFLELCGKLGLRS